MKNIFARSHIEHCWRWFKSYAFMNLKSSSLSLSLKHTHTHLLGAPILGPLQVFTNKESRSKHHKIHILHFFLAIWKWVYETSFNIAEETFFGGWTFALWSQCFFFWKFLYNASSKKKKCSNKILRKNHKIFNPKKKKPPPEFTLLL
jgi:hypothetical protein